MEAPYPTEIRRLPDADRIRIQWTDGHVCEYPNDYLRGYCPCAGCQGHAAGPVVFQPPDRPVSAATIVPVGNYAISIHWSDGHATGIYRFEFLREIVDSAYKSDRWRYRADEEEPF